MAIPFLAFRMRWMSASAAVRALLVNALGAKAISA